MATPDSMSVDNISFNPEKGTVNFYITGWKDEKPFNVMGLANAPLIGTSAVGVADTSARDAVRALLRLVAEQL